MKYPIHEMFYTFQGEGRWMGMPAFFVRTFGCPVRCAFCDAAGTWHPEYVPKGIPKLESLEIVEEAKRSGAHIVVVTGGEPAIHDLGELTAAICGFGMAPHLETSGAYPIRGAFDWVVLSPKRAKWPLPESVEKANEFKFVIESPGDIRFFWDLLIEVGGFRENDGRDIWLHPEWSQRNNPKVLEAIVTAVKGASYQYRAGWQLHKLYQADTFDSRSRPLVPLGGNLAKGF